jgi:hypothetical protein
MDWTLWAGFVVASLIVGLLPGPGVTSIVGYALTSGLRSALGSVFGATAGNAVAMAFSLAGVGVMIEQYPAAFSILKWVGAAYLIAIGFYGIVTASRAEAVESADVQTIHPHRFLGYFRDYGGEPEDHYLLRRLHASVHVASLELLVASRSAVRDFCSRRHFERRFLCRGRKLGRVLPQGSEGACLGEADRRRGVDGGGYRDGNRQRIG